MLTEIELADLMTNEMKLDDVQEPSANSFSVTAISLMQLANFTDWMLTEQDHVV